MHRSSFPRTCLFALAIVSLGAIPGAAQEDSDEQTPDPVAIARASAEFVAGLPAFGFSWFVSYDEVIDGREKLTFLRSGHNIMLRGKGFAAFAELGTEHRDFYFDGKSFTISAPDENFYATAPFEGSFEALVDAARAHTGTVLPLWTLMSADLPERISPDDENVAAAYVGETLIAGQPVHHLSFASDEEDWQIWVSTDEAAPLPLMLVGTRTNQQGWPQYRVYITNWDIDPDIPEDAVVFVPDDDDLPVAMPALGSADEADGSTNSDQNEEGK